MDWFHGSFEVGAVVVGLMGHMMDSMVLGVLGVALLAMVLGSRPSIAKAVAFDAPRAPHGLLPRR